jgi:membrane protein YdbS with pleckstrin-like domain
VKPTIMVPIERFLAKGEILQVRTSPHWIVFLRSIVTATAILCVATGLAVMAFESPTNRVSIYAALSAGAVAVAFAVLASATLQRNSQIILVTDRRIVALNGVLRHTTSETRLASVQSIDLDQSVLGRLLNFGTITLRTGNDEPMVLENIAFPLELHQALQDHRSVRREFVASPEDYAAGA